MKHIDDDDLPLAGTDPEDALLALLDRQEQPDPGLQQRFAARLAQAGHKADARRQGPLTMLFQRYWPARPVWAFAYSCCLLSAGLVAGQWLPGSMDDGAQASTALICPVLSAPVEWLPALDQPRFA